MKLLISCATLGHGGAERVLSILSHAFADSFDEVIYLMWLKDNIFYEIDSRIRLVFLPDLSGHNNRYRELYTFRKFIKNENPDLILSFLTPFNMLVQISTIGLRNKVVVCERNDPHYVPGGKIMEWMRDLTYKWALGILTQTDYSKNCYKGQLREKTTVIYNPVLMKKELVGSGLQTPKLNRIISVGRLHPQKNQKMLIDAFSMFVNKHQDYELVIYGEGPLKNDLEQYIKSLGLIGKIKFPGHSNNVWDDIKSSKVFVLSSIAEGMSNALIEAMCLGVPVISTKVAGAVDLIIDSDNGFLINQNDALKMSQRMCEIVENDTLAEALGKHGSYLYNRLNEKIISSQWIEYIKNCLNQNND